MFFGFRRCGLVKYQHDFNNRAPFFSNYSSSTVVIVYSRSIIIIHSEIVSHNPKRARMRCWHGLTVALLVLLCLASAAAKISTERTTHGWGHEEGERRSRDGTQTYYVLLDKERGQVTLLALLLFIIAP